MITAAQSAQRRATVALVDDDSGQRYIMTRFLREAGFEIVEASSGKEALAVAKQLPDAMVLDVHLPDLDGFEVCRRIKEDPLTKTVLILQTSAVFREGDDRVRGLDGGADAYLVQPVKPAELLATLRAVLRIRHVEAEQVRLQKKVELLADASKIVAGSLEYEKTLSTLARRLVEDFADVCLIQLLDRGGEPSPLLSAAHDPSHERELVPLYAGRALDAIAAGAPELVRELHAAAGRKLSVMTLPMKNIGGEDLGAMVLIALDRIYEAGDLAFAEDVARRSAVAIEHARLFEDARRAVRARDEILSIVSHDLRTPLDTILMSAYLIGRTLPEGETGAKLKSYLERVERPARRMEALLADLIDVTAIDSGKLSISQVEEDLSVLIRELRESFEPEAAKREIGFEVEAPASLTVKMDRRRISQACSNLIQNALKYTPSGGKVRVCVAQAADGVQISVEDNGPGIAPENIERIFDRGWRAKAESHHEGIGLGLFITRGIVAAHGGHILVESTVGRGSKFTIILK